MSERKDSSGFVVVWEFRVRPGRRKAFEKAYGPGGDWVKLFQHDPAYLRAELIRDRVKLTRYLTLDFWHSRKAYQEFKKKNRKDYALIDKNCELLTASERMLGEFDHIRQSISAVVRTEKLGNSGQRSQTQIRAASPDDIPAILELERGTPSAAHWPEPTYRRIFEQQTPRCLALVAEKGNAGPDRMLNGFVIGRISADECELENIVVRRQCQNRGLGSRLLHALANDARQQKATKIFLEVRESNSAARGLYEKCRFRITGRRKAYYTNPGEDAVLYTLEL